MKLMKIELIVLDMDNIGEEGVRAAIENANYPNRCIAPDVRSVEVRDIGEWADDHPLNRTDTAEAEIIRIFADK